MGDLAHLNSLLTSFKFNPNVTGYSCKMSNFAFYIILLFILLSKNFVLAQNEITKIDLLTKENTKTHHTSDYEIVHSRNNPALVIRRGDPFYLSLHLRRNYDSTRDKIRLEFMFGKYEFVW